MEANIEDILKAESEGIEAGLLESIKHPGWELTESEPCLQYKLNEEGRNSAKGLTDVNFSVREVFDFLGKQDTLGRLNDQLKELKRLFTSQDGNLEVNHFIYNGMWPVKGRDFVSLTIKNFKSDQLAVISTKTCKNFNCPPHGDSVRGTVVNAGYLIEKVGENKTRVTYVSNVDLAGSLPTMVANMLAKKESRVPVKIEALMLQDKAKR